MNPPERRQAISNALKAFASVPLREVIREEIKAGGQATLDFGNACGIFMLMQSVRKA